MSAKHALLPLALVIVTGVATVWLLPQSDKTTTGPAIALVLSTDCSSSMRGVLLPLREPAAQITEEAARPDSLLAAGTFPNSSGQNDTPWAVVDRYRLDVRATEGNRRKALERITARGRRNAASVRTLLNCPSGLRGGSPLFSALEDSATVLADGHLPRTTSRRVVLFSDAAIVGDGIDARRRVTPAEANAVIARFSPRLAGLRGAKIWIIGAGSGTNIDRRTFVTIRRIIERLATKVGAQLMSFGPSPTGYPATLALDPSIA